jgi:hypothetical protein
MDEEVVELYGFPTEDIEAIRMQVEALFGVAFDRYVSPAAGGYYFTEFCSGHAELTLRENTGIFENEETGEDEEGMVEPDFPDAGVLLYVEWKDSSHGCRARGRGLEEFGELLAVEE